MIFIDASAIVAVLTSEPEADVFAAEILQSHEPITSPIAIFEATLAISRKLQVPLDQALAEVEEFISAANLQVAPISAEDGPAALAAHAIYGKGRGHPARLNLGDCFAYAMAKSRNAALLFKGDDFAQTDIRIAVSLS